MSASRAVRRVLALLLVGLLAPAVHARPDGRTPSQAEMDEVKDLLRQGDRAQRAAEDAAARHREAREDLEAWNEEHGGVGAEPTFWGGADGGEPTGFADFARLLAEAGGPTDAHQVAALYDAYVKRFRALASAAAAHAEALAREQELREAAIRRADEIYGLTPPRGMEGEPAFGGSAGGVLWLLRRKGWTPYLFREAFHSPGGVLSPGWLAAAKMRVFVAIEQRWDGRQHLRRPEGASEGWRVQEYLINEVEQLDRVLAEAERLGLTPSEVQALKAERDERAGRLVEKNRKRVDAGEYGTDPVDVDPRPELRQKPISMHFYGEDTRRLPPPFVAPGAPVAAMPDTRPAEITPGPSVAFFGNGTTFGVDVHVRNPGTEPLVLDLPQGGVLLPVHGRVQPMILGGAPAILLDPGAEGWATVPAFCTDRGKEAPPPDEPLRLVLEPGPNASDGDTPRTWAFKVQVTDPDPASPAQAEAQAEADRLSGGPVLHVLLEAERQAFDRSGGLFATPTEDPLGPFERATTPQEPDPFLVVLPEDSPFARNGTPVPLLLPTPERAEPEAPTFADTVRTQAVWAATDGGVDRERIEQESTEQFRAQGASEEKARRAGQQVADEVVDAVQGVLDRVVLDQDEDLDFHLDLTRKEHR